jgi:hypothetical protein
MLAPVNAAGVIIPANTKPLGTVVAILVVAAFAIITSALDLNMIYSSFDYKTQKARWYIIPPGCRKSTILAICNQKVMLPPMP